MATISLPVRGVSDLRSITYGETKGGEIDSGDPTGYRGHYEPVSFDGEEGDVITIQMTSPGDPYLVLQAPSGDEVMEDDDGYGSDYNSEIADFALDETGEYTIIATSFSEDATFEYTLSLEAESGSETTDNQQQQSNALNNQHLTIFVGDRGKFKLSTADGEQLTYPQRSTSGLTIQVDGTNYVVGQPAGTSMRQYQNGETSFNEDMTAATTRWELPESVTVTQQISLSAEAASFDLSVENNGGGRRTIKIRYLFDYQVGPQDGAPIFVNGEVLTTETRFESPDFQRWKTYDQIPEPTLVGEGHQGTTPDRISFVHWPEASESGYEYAQFDPDRAFYQSGYTNTPESDSCGLLFWNLGTLESGETSTVNTFYGVGSPDKVSITAIENAIIDYRTAVSEYFDAFVTGKARANATLYSERGEEYATNLVNYFGYRAELDDISARDIDEDIRRQLDELIRDTETETAATLYRFYDEMFEAASPGGDVSEITATFEEFFRGTHADQSQYFTVDGQRLGSFITSVESTVEDHTSEFLEQLRNSDQTPDSETVDQIARVYEEKAAQARRRSANMTSNFDSLATAVREGQEARGQFTSAEVGPTGNLFVSATGIVTVGAAALKGVSVLKGAAIIGGTVSTLAGISSVVQSMQTQSISWLQWEAIHSWQRRRDMVDTANNLKDLAEKSTELGLEIVEVAGERVTISDISIGNISEEDIPTENGARVAKKTGTVTLQNPYTDRDVTITPTFVGDQCYITQINASGEPTEYFGKVIVPSSEHIPELEPGEETAVDFTCIVPLDIETGSYELSMTVQANAYAIYEAHWFTSFGVDIDASSVMESQKLTDGTLAEGDATRTPYEPSDNAITGTIRMDYGGSDLDLHLYDSSGQHVGRNYDTGEIEREIAGVTYSGPDGGTESSEWIRADDISQPSGLESEVVALETSSDGSSFSVTAVDIPALPPELRVYPNPIMLAGEVDSTLERDLTVAEIGGDTAPEDLSLEISELIHEAGDHTIDDATIEIDDTVSINAGGQTMITLTMEVPEEGYNGTYKGTVMVDGDESAYTANLNVVITEGKQQNAAASEGTNILPNIPPWAATATAGGGTALGIAGLLKYLSRSNTSGENSD